MPGYLVKTANFVAEIQTDEELIHLAEVETIQKDTLIRALPATNWVAAKKMPILRKIWGLESDSPVPPPIQIAPKGAQPAIKNKLPPRLSTAIDNVDNIQMPVQHPANVASTVSEAIDETLFSVAADIVADEAQDLQAITNAAASSMIFEISEFQEKNHAQGENVAGTELTEEDQTSLSCKASLVSEETAEASDELCREHTVQDVIIHQTAVTDMRQVSAPDDDVREFLPPYAQAVASDMHETLLPDATQEILSPQFAPEESTQAFLPPPAPVNAPASAQDTLPPPAPINAPASAQDTLPPPAPVNAPVSAQDTLPPLAPVNAPASAQDTLPPPAPVNAPVSAQDTLPPSAPVNAPVSAQDTLPPPAPVNAPASAQDTLPPPAPVNAPASAQDTLPPPAPVNAPDIDIRQESEQNASLAAPSIVSSEKKCAQEEIAAAKENDKMSSHDGHDEDHAAEILSQIRHMSASYDVEIGPDDVTYVIDADEVSDEPQVKTENRKTSDDDSDGVADNAQTSSEVLEPQNDAEESIDKTYANIAAPIDESAEKSEAAPSQAHVYEVAAAPESIDFDDPFMSAATIPIQKPKFDGEDGDICRTVLFNKAQSEKTDILPESKAYESRFVSRVSASPRTLSEEHARMKARSRVRKLIKRGQVSGQNNDRTDAVLESGLQPQISFEYLSEHSEKASALAEDVQTQSADDARAVQSQNSECASDDTFEEDQTATYVDMQTEELRAARMAVDAAKKMAQQQGTHISSDILQHAASLVDALEEAHSKTFERTAYAPHRGESVNGSEGRRETVAYGPERDAYDEPPSEMFKIRSRNELKLAAEASLLQPEYNDLNAMQTHPSSQRPDDDEHTDEHSDAFKIRDSAEFRRMLSEKAVGESKKHPKDKTAKQDSLRSLFEQEDELHLLLANEIREKESEKVPENAEKVSSPSDESIEISHTPSVQDISRRLMNLTAERPVNHEKAVVRPSPSTAETTSITSSPYAFQKAAISFQDDFFQDKLLPEETPIDHFKNLYLTSHRIWNISGTSDNIVNYEIYDVENVRSVGLIETKNFLYLSFAAVIAAVLALYYFRFNASTYVVILLICALLSLPLCYIKAYRTTLQIKVDDTILKSQCSSKDRKDAMVFLSRVDAVRSERRRQIKR